MAITNDRRPVTPPYRINVPRPAPAPVVNPPIVGQTKFKTPGGEKKVPMSSQELAVMYQNIIQNRLNPDERNKINNRQENADVTSGIGSGIEQILKGMFAGGAGAKDTGHWDKSRQIFRQRQADREARKDSRLTNLERLQKSAKGREDSDPTAPANRTLQNILIRRNPEMAEEIKSLSPQQIKDHGKYIFQRGKSSETEADKALKGAKTGYYNRRGGPSGSSESEADKELKKAKAGYYGRKGGASSAEEIAHKKNQYELLAVKLKAAQEANSPEGIAAIKKRMAELTKTDMEEGPTRRAFKKTDELRKNYYGHPTTRTTDKMDSAYRKVQNAAKNPSPAGDLSLIFAYMKMLDADSAVKEGEFATAQNATSVPGAIRNKYNQIISGKRLNPAQRKDFETQAGNVWKSQLGAQKSIDNRFMEYSTKQGINFGEFRGTWQGQKDDIGDTKKRFNKYQNTPTDGKARLNKVLNKGGGPKMHKVMPPGGTTPVMVPGSDLDEALKNGGKLVE